MRKVEWEYDGKINSKLIYEMVGIDWQHALKRGTKKGGIKSKMEGFKRKVWIGVGFLCLGFILQSIGVIITG